ncbi:hypothetical protein TNCT_117861 [Trichonephila clavata]|uniref:Uncharacterized protein n=1 Tax=Trichonephila clavata TaxID=2740835 RepID=A0A8X6L4R8_TRICU|nr:hypothetical protein TNCT_117861 [Trichonephila clavata]
MNFEIPQIICHSKQPTVPRLLGSRYDFNSRLRLRIQYCSAQFCRISIVPAPVCRIPVVFRAPVSDSVVFGLKCDRRRQCSGFSIRFEGFILAPALQFPSCSFVRHRFALWWFIYSPA